MTERTWRILDNNAAGSMKISVNVQITYIATPYTAQLFIAQ